MESGTELDSFLKAVLNGQGAPEDFACTTFFTESLPLSSPAAPPATQPASSEPEATEDVSEPEAGLDCIEPKATLDSSEPKAALDSSEPDAALDSSEPDAALDSSEPDAALDSSEPDAALDFEALLDSLEWEEVRATLTAAVEDLLADACLVSNSQPSEPSTVEPDALPPQEPQSEMELKSFKTPNWTEVMENPVQETYQSGTIPPSQVPEVMAGPYHPMAAPQMPNRKPVVPASMLRPACMFNGQMMYTYVAEPCAYSNVTSRKRQRDSHDNTEKPYIKKPLNAFMLFRAEQRQKVMEELKITDSSEVCKVIGQRWKMLSQEEQAVYFEQAHALRRAHEAKYPDWSPNDNFGKKAKRRRAAYTTVPTAYDNRSAAPAAPVWDNSTMMWPTISGHFPLVPSYQPPPGYYGPVHWQTPSC